MEPTWYALPDVMQLIIGILFAAFLWFMVRTLKQIDTNQRILFQRLESLEKEFYTMRGEHNVRYPGRRYEDLP